MKLRHVLVIFLLVSSPVHCSAGGGAYKVVHGWPRLPEGFAFGQVTGVGVDSHNHVFVFHRGHPPVMCFEGETGKLLRSWGDGMFATPHGLAVDPHDNIWVTDIDHHQVYKFSHDGALLMTVGEKDVPGVNGKHLNGPTDVAVARDGSFYVSDGYGNSRVAKFSAQGAFLFDWGRKGDQVGEFDTPHGIGLNAQGLIYVADRGNARVQVFDPNGKFLAQWKRAELGRPWDVTVGPDALVYVIDGGDVNPDPPGRGRVTILSAQGKILDAFGSFGSYDGQFYWGHAVVAGKDGAVYVTDVHVGMRVQKFRRLK